jgi:hypothetical protein
MAAQGREFGLDDTISLDVAERQFVRNSTTAQPSGAARAALLRSLSQGPITASL